jgi:hypothetical protein
MICPTFEGEAKKVRQVWQTVPCLTRHTPPFYRGVGGVAGHITPYLPHLCPTLQNHPLKR